MTGWGWNKSTRCESEFSVWFINIPKKHHHGLSDGHCVWEELQTQTHSSKVTSSISYPQTWFYTITSHQQKNLAGTFGIISKESHLGVHIHMLVFTRWTWTWSNMIRNLILLTVVIRMRSNTFLYTYYWSLRVAAVACWAPTAYRLLNQKKRSLAC